jgi:hypothetical protein
MKRVREMTDEELMAAEFHESCSDDGYGRRLKELREEVIRRMKIASQRR